MKEINTDSYLASTINIKVRLLTSMPQVRRKLSNYPNLRQTGNGNTLKYVVELENRDKFYTISLTDKDFVLELHSKTSPLYFIHEALLRMLSLAAVLSEDYEFDIRSLFPYLVETLASQIPKPQISRMESAIPQTPGEIILSSRINALNRENLQLGNEISSTRSKFLRMTSLFIISRYGPSVEVNEVSKECGISNEEVTKALMFMPELGYRALSLGHDRFNLVRV